jgi:protein-disulfide isomerase
MKGYEACMKSGRHDAGVEKSVASGQGLGFNSTPTFQFVNESDGKTYSFSGAEPMDVFELWIDALLAGKAPPQEKQPPKPELPLWAKPAGLAPDPTRPGFTMAGDPYKGSPDAALVLVEFGDFQCPACQRHALTTQPALDKRFVDTGEVRWVVKHFPLRMHARAPVAAAAAECAGDQGKFWQMHHLLFEQLDGWSSANDVDAALTGLASRVGVEKAKFAGCLAGRDALQRVLRDLFDGQAIGIKNIPAFVLLHGETGTVLVGARSADQFGEALQQQLKAANSPTKRAEISASR